ncbi:MAG: permease-like cell division protein FtsX [Clostridiales bacterium]|nr:permease-like cell division protein FtsX [Clostridiales bacterium]
MTKFRYLTKEGFRNLRVNSLMSIASITVLFSCLLLIGVAFMMMQNIRIFLENIEKENVILVYCDLDATDYDYMNLGNSIKALPNVASVESIDKETAYENILSELDDNLKAYLESINENPLPDAYKITVTDMSQFDKTVDSVKRLDNVLRVHENSDLARELETMRNAVAYISLGVIGLLLIVSLFIISNTIKVTMFSRKLEINIMKSVGATRAFIRWPFMVEGVIIGIVASVIALLAVWAVNDYALGSVFSIFTTFGTTVEVKFIDYAQYLTAAFLGIGIFTGLFGSSASLNKYLKERKFVELDD